MTITSKYLISIKHTCLVSMARGFARMYFQQLLQPGRAEQRNFGAWSKCVTWGLSDFLTSKILEVMCSFKESISIFLKFQDISKIIPLSFEFFYINFSRRVLYLNSSRKGGRGSWGYCSQFEIQSPQSRNACTLGEYLTVVSNICIFSYFMLIWGGGGGGGGQLAGATRQTVPFFPPLDGPATRTFNFSNLSTNPNFGHSP